MPLSRRALLSLSLSALTLAACGGGRPPKLEPASGDTPEMHALIKKWARIHDIPESLLHRQIRRESGYNPAARNGPYYGLLQIHPQTAATMGYRGPRRGPARCRNQPALRWQISARRLAGVAWQ